MGNLFESYSGLSFFSADQKADLIANKTAFYITAVEQRASNGEYNPQWVVAINLCDDLQTEGLLGFSIMTDEARAKMAEGFASRDEIFEKLADMISADGKPYGPCCLFQGKKPSDPLRKPFVGIRDVVEAPLRPTVYHQNREEQDPF